MQIDAVLFPTVEGWTSVPWDCSDGPNMAIHGLYFVTQCFFQTMLPKTAY